MGSESVVIMNPKDNNRDLVITATGQSGKTIRLARLKPGKSYRAEKEEFRVRAVRRPVTLDAVLSGGGVYEVSTLK